ncbi:MAG TPA: T9SS type A sorting domain-containing protein [Puia sp.]|nr:T9SS type A sorting domain-containing protein [Puia sp.]
MKKLYSLTLCAISSFLTLAASAQTTYTAVLPGNWHNASTTDHGIWHDAEPPANCSNCIIQLMGAGIVHLNASVNLSNNSSVVVGPGVTLVVDNSGKNTFATANNIILSTQTNSTLLIEDNTASLDASSASVYDGVLTSTPDGANTDYLKQYGTNGLFFINDQEINFNASSYGISAFGPKTFNSSSGTLPIILAGFSAAANDGQVDLSWSTALESNSDHFAVQRSNNAGADWTTIGAVGAAGNSNAMLNYSYTDGKPGQGTAEYRLELIDKDGKYSYSDVKSIRIGIVTAVNLYPNPAHDYVNVTLGDNAGEPVLIRLFNQAGQVLIEKNVTNAGGTTVPLAVSSYPEGNYIIVVSAADGSRQVNKLVITK